MEKISKRVLEIAQGRRDSDIQRLLEKHESCIKEGIVIIYIK